MEVLPRLGKVQCREHRSDGRSRGVRRDVGGYPFDLTRCVNCKLSMAVPINYSKYPNRFKRHAGIDAFRLTIERHNRRQG